MIKRRIAAVTQFISWPIAFILFNSFLDIKINGKENLKKVASPFVIISNHVSFYDSFVFRLICGFFSKKLPLRFMAVRRFNNKYLNLLSDLKFIDIVYAVFGVFVVEPGRGIQKNLEEAQRIIETGGNVVLYPEGCVVKDGNIKEFKPGAAVLTQRTGVNVLPISMRLGKRKFFRREFVVNIGEMIVFDRNLPIPEITNAFHAEIVRLYNRG